MKKLFTILFISIFILAGVVIAGDKVPTTQSGRPYYDIYDEDTMVSDSATGIPTQQSVKAYVDTEVNANTKFINVIIPDVSSASTTYAVMPVAGTITRSTGVLGASITGASAVINISAYGSAMGSMTVYTSSTAGTVDYVVPSAISIAKDTAISLQTYGSSTGAATEWITLEITPE